MSTLNQDLQASYHIISLLEKSKANSEEIIDRLPDIFVVIDTQGTILKGNHEAAQRFGVGLEMLIGSNISRLFLEETWNLFSVYLNQAKALAPTDKPIEFELPIDVRVGSERICYWTLSVLDGVPHAKGPLFCLIGRDITLLRAYQKQLAEIFASIPLGIFTVDRDGKIEDTFSAYSQWLLGTDEIAGVTLRKLIFENCIEYLDAAAREGWTNLLDFSSYSLREFDFLAETFPKQFFYPMPGSKESQGRYLGMKIQSISHGQRVDGILVILEDRTTLVEAEKADEKQKLLQDQSLERALQIKKCDPDMLSVTVNDLKILFSQLGDAIFVKDAENFQNILHAIKGNGRLAGFTMLVKLSHSLESRIRESEEGKVDWKTVFAYIDEIRNEWKELYSLVKVLAEPQEASAEQTEGNREDETSSMFKMLTDWQTKFASQFSESMNEELSKLATKARQLSFNSIHSLESSLRHSAQNTAATLGKKIKLVFDWEEEIKIDATDLTQIRNALLHLINNAIDHGVESPEERLELKKPLQGTIRISAYIAGDRLVFNVEDDGRGVNTEKVRIKAIEKKIITPEKAKSLSEDDARQLILAQGFSTAETVSEISGRGVGLSAVAETVKSYSGEIEVKESKYGGTAFYFFVRVPGIES